MKEIYVNLKRFEVPKSMGGICPLENPVDWMRQIIHETAEYGLGNIEGVDLTYFVPESMVLPALDAVAAEGPEKTGCLKIGCAGVFREDVEPGGNFGAFTTNKPAAALKAIGCSWVVVGHSEERKDKLSFLKMYDEAENAAGDIDAALRTVEKTINAEMLCALRRGMSVLYCIGETEEQKGSDDPAVYEPRVREVLRRQVTEGLAGMEAAAEGQKVAIAYEPIWAIGPGKTPASGEYVSFVSSCIKEICREVYGKELSVVYGGGLKEENAEELAAVKTIDGGFVALTKFVPPIAFDVASLKNIIQAYVK